MTSQFFAENDLPAPLDSAFVQLVHQLLAEYMREIRHLRRTNNRAGLNMMAYFDLLRWISEEAITSVYQLALTLVKDLFPLNSDGGYWAIWEPVLDFCIDAADQLGDGEIAGIFHCYLARLLYQRGHWDAALDHAQRAVVYIHRQTSPTDFANALNIVIEICQNRGKLDEVEELFDHAFEAIDPSVSVEAYCRLQLQQAAYFHFTGHLATAVEIATEVIDLLNDHAIDDQMLTANAYNWSFD